MSMANTHEELLAELELELVPDPPDLETELAKPDADRFRITGPREAEWALLKIGQAARRRDELLEVVAAERARLADYEARAQADYAGTAEFFEGLLEEWHRTHNIEPELAKARTKARAELGPEADDDAVEAAAWRKVKGKTHPLPAGKVSARRTADRVTFPHDELVDERREEFTAWARAEVPELVRVKHEPDLKAVTAAVATGEELVAMAAVLAGMPADEAELARERLEELEAANADAGTPSVALVVGPDGAVFTLEGERVPHLELVRGVVTYKAEALK